MGRRKRRSTAGSTGAPAYERGCCLSCCLLGVGIQAVVVLLGGLALMAVVSAVLGKVCPQLQEQLSSLKLLVALFWSIPPLAVAVLGLVLLLQVVAIWRGQRWGVYGMALLVASHVVLTCWGTDSLDTLWEAVRSLVPTLFWFSVLLLLIRPKWKAMR